MFQLGLAGDLDVAGQSLGLVLDIGGYYKNVITLAPSLHISQEEMDLGLAALDVVLEKSKHYGDPSRTHRSLRPKSGMPT
jgi:hypothetical protein